MRWRLRLASSVCHAESRHGYLTQERRRVKEGAGRALPVESLPIVIRELKLRGFRFARWHCQKVAATAIAATSAEP